MDALLARVEAPLDAYLGLPRTPVRTVGGPRGYDPPRPAPRWWRGLWPHPAVSLGRRPLEEGCRPRRACRGSPPLRQPRPPSRSAYARTNRRRRSRSSRTATTIPTSRAWRRLRGRRRAGRSAKAPRLWRARQAPVRPCRWRPVPPQPRRPSASRARISAPGSSARRSTGRAATAQDRRRRDLAASASSGRTATSASTTSGSRPVGSASRSGFRARSDDPNDPDPAPLHRRRPGDRGPRRPLDRSASAP